MKISRSTVKLLSSFKIISSSLVFTKPSRFYIFGEGKEKEFCSLVVEGTIKERINQDIICSIPQIGDKELLIYKEKYADPIKKIYFFNKLMKNSKEITSFSISETIYKDICKLDRNKPTHIRLWSKSSDYVFARPFDARKYYENQIEIERIKYQLFELSNLKGDDFISYIEYPVFKQLKKDTYNVTVFDNGILIFDGIETGLTYYIRDQRLGVNWQDEINETIGEESVLLLHPKLVKEVHHKMKSHN